MWNACAKLPRLEAALRMRGIDPDNFSLRALDKVLAKRGITDRTLNPIMWTLIDVLEPPSCSMTHCKFFGGQQAPMNCSDGRTPGRCTIYREYKKRKAERSAELDSRSGADSRSTGGK